MHGANCLCSIADVLGWGDIVWNVVTFEATEMYISKQNKGRKVEEVEFPAGWVHFVCLLHEKADGRTAEGIMRQE